MPLTPRQWKLYNFIKEKSKKGEKTSQSEICENVAGYTWKEKSASTHDNCIMIWTDVERINNDPKIEKFIIQKNGIYWIANEDDVEEYLTEKWNNISPRLKRYWNIVNKVKKNGQVKLFNSEGKPFDENTRARIYVESFLPSNVQGE